MLTDDGGDATDTYIYDAWGNEVDGIGTSVNPFRWVGNVGYYWDDGTGTFYIRARVYEPLMGRWMSQDPLFYPVSNLSGPAHLQFSLTFLLAFPPRYRGSPPHGFGSQQPIGNTAGANLERYGGTNPVTLIDPSGLRECTCDCKGLIPFNTKLNDKINSEIRAAAQVAADPAMNPMGKTFSQILRDRLATDVVGTGPAPMTEIEQWIHYFVPTNLVNNGSSFAGLVDTADCIAISCGGITTCIGSDKVGHFVQQGFMLHELNSAFGEPYALAFNLWSVSIPTSLE
jgi:RHS repeat-associated protein